MLTDRWTKCNELKGDYFKAIDQLDHVMSVIAVTVRKVIQKLIIQMDFPYQTEVKKRAKKVCLVPKINFS